MKRKIALLLATFSIVMSIAVPVSASASDSSPVIIKPFTHGVGGL
ncbi:hypothetical protein [Paenibacillus sp. DMB20]|nr:hypothetical protein [Paenibacillus sp. DMB20]